MTWTVVGVIAVLLVWVGIQIGIGYFDRRRIADYAESQGWKLLSINQPGMGPKWFSDWFGAPSDRIYEINITEPGGITRTLRCKTSATDGTYSSDDRTDPLKIKFPRP